jgi:carbonic anhydrase
MSVIDELVRNADSYNESFENGELPLPPAKPLAVVACMDARLNPYSLLGLHEGDAHVIRNAGGVITDDEIRSLAISQRLLGTEEIMLIHHTDCGMLTLPRPGRSPVDRADQGEPVLPKKDQVRGFVYEVESGRLREVT